MGNIMTSDFKTNGHQIIYWHLPAEASTAVANRKLTGPQAFVFQIQYLKILIERGHLLVAKISVGSKRQTNSLTKLQYQTKNPLMLLTNLKTATPDTK